MGVHSSKATKRTARLPAKGKKGNGGSPGNSGRAGLPAKRPHVTIVVEGRSPHDPQAAALSQGLGAFAASALAGGLHPGAAGGLGPMMQAALQTMAPQDPAPTRTRATKPQARGKRRGAAGW